MNLSDVVGTPEQGSDSRSPKKPLKRRHSMIGFDHDTFQRRAVVASRAARGTPSPTQLEEVVKRINDDLEMKKRLIRADIRDRFVLIHQLQEQLTSLTREVDDLTQSFMSMEEGE